jgi:predicted TIM-barrel fold metal-dependent hydrolase
VHADTLLAPLFADLRERLGTVELFDAHTHIGRNDPDGFRCSAAELDEALVVARARAVVFAMQEPDGYREANDEVLEAADASGGRLVPFCRLDPRDDPVAEARRALALGARGIKLHPRAERFTLHEPEVEPILALADERELPLLVHAGRGVPALGHDSLVLAGRFPGAKIILAHAAISDLSWLWAHLPEHPNLFVDTSWWSAPDLLTLFGLAPPGQLLWASDAPYGTPVQATILSGRCALQAGLSADQVAGVLGGTLHRLLAGEPRAELGPAPGTPRIEVDLLLDRVHTFLVTAMARMIVGDSGSEPLALARLAAAVPPDAPQAAVCAWVLELLDRHRDYTAEYPIEDGRPRFPGIHLIAVAAGLARTPDVGVPSTS